MPAISKRVKAGGKGSGRARSGCAPIVGTVCSGSGRAACAAGCALQDQDMRQTRKNVRVADGLVPDGAVVLPEPAQGVQRVDPILGQHQEQGIAFRTADKLLFKNRTVRRSVGVPLQARAQRLAHFLCHLTFCHFLFSVF